MYLFVVWFVSFAFFRTDWKRLFQSLRSYEVQQHVNWTYVSIQTVIIGQYYFGKSTQSRLVELPEPVTFFRSYCKLHKKRKLFPQQISALNYTENIVDRVIVHSYGHQLEISETSNSLIDSEVFGRVQVCYLQNSGGNKLNPVHAGME